MTINEMRDLSGMSLAAFGRTYGIPLRTLQDWAAGKREPSEYMRALLERVVLEDFRPCGQVYRNPAVHCLYRWCVKWSSEDGASGTAQFQRKACAELFGRMAFRTRSEALQAEQELEKLDR